MFHGRISRLRRSTLVVGLILLSLAGASCAPRDRSDRATAGSTPATLDPVQRAVEDRMATIDAGIPLMRAVRRTDRGQDGGTLELVGWLAGDSIAVVQGTARLPDGGGSDFRYYYEGPRLMGFRRNDRYMNEPAALAGKTLQSAALFDANGGLILWSQTAAGRPLPMRTERRDWLVRQFVNEGTGWRNLMTRMAGDSLGRTSEKGSTP